jgi:hypothetical protein
LDQQLQVVSVDTEQIANVDAYLQTTATPNASAGLRTGLAGLD